MTADHSINANGDMGIGTENQYDANGNFLTAKVNTVTKTYNYYSNTNKVQNTDGSGNDYVYDASGKIISSSPKGISALTYDPFINRTRTIAIGASSMNFQYDGTERRIYRKEVVSGVTSEVLYLHDGMNAIHERTKTGTVTEYVYGPTGIIAYGSAFTWKYVIKDHLGSTRAVVDGTTVTGYDYSAFGSILAPVTPNTNYMYTGQEYDKTSGLHNYKARMYDSDLMRFYGMDAGKQYTSPFTYVGNNPINLNDPSGNWSFDWKNLIPGRGLYLTAKNMYKAYNRYGGLHGALEAFAVANQSIISAGYSTVASAVTANLLPNVVTNQFANELIKSTVSGGVGGAAGSVPSGGNVMDGALNGATTAAVYQTATELRTYYNKVVGYDVTWKRGGDAVKKDYLQKPVKGANNIGTQGKLLNPNGLFNEGGIVSRLANQVPGINAIAGLHDIFQVTLSSYGEGYRSWFNLPGMGVAAAMTLPALIVQPLDNVPFILHPQNWNAIER